MDVLRHRSRFSLGRPACARRSLGLGRALGGSKEVLFQRSSAAALPAACFCFVRLALDSRQNKARLAAHALCHLSSDI
jgi:hypothetical protein